MCEQKQTPPVKVEVKNLTKKFGDLLVLDNISFDVYQGDLLCVVGPTGCGKTTFLNSLTKIYGNTAQKKVPKTAECDKINLWINR